MGLLLIKPAELLLFYTGADNILTELCSRSIAEAVHLRDRVSQIIAIS